MRRNPKGNLQIEEACLWRIQTLHLLGHPVWRRRKIRSNFPHPSSPCLQSSRFRRRSVSRDVRGQAGAGALCQAV